jgi:hypothetical protein
MFSIDFLFFIIDIFCDNLRKSFENGNCLNSFSILIFDTYSLFIIKYSKLLLLLLNNSTIFSPIERLFFLLL